MWTECDALEDEVRRTCDRQAMDHDGLGGIGGRYGEWPVRPDVFDPDETIIAAPQGDPPGAGAKRLLELFRRRDDDGRLGCLGNGSLARMTRMTAASAKIRCLKLMDRPDGGCPGTSIEAVARKAVTRRLRRGPPSGLAIGGPRRGGRPRSERGLQHRAETVEADREEHRGCTRTVTPAMKPGLRSTLTTCATERAEPRRLSQSNVPGRSRHSGDRHTIHARADATAGQSTQCCEQDARRSPLAHRPIDNQVPVPDDSTPYLQIRSSGNRRPFKDRPTDEMFPDPVKPLSRM